MIPVVVGKPATTGEAPIAQLAEATDLKSVKCRFKSDWGHQKDQITAQFEASDVHPTWLRYSVGTQPSDQPIARIVRGARAALNTMMQDFHATIGLERRRAEHRLASLREGLESIIEGSRWTTDDDEHDPEGSTIAFERAKIASLIADTEAELRDLEAATTRLRSGEYGICEVCQEPIADARLEALPTARQCIECVRRSR